MIGDTNKLQWSGLITVTSWLAYLLTLAGVVWLVLRGGEQLGYNWHWQKVVRYIAVIDDGGQFAAGPLLDGLWVTCKITLISLLLAGLIGLVTALLRLSSSILGRSLARVYLELVRNTPLLVQIFFLYFVMAPVFDIGRTATAILALSAFEGAYASEIFRAGIQAVDQGQWEACHSLGITRLACYRHVILPQAIRHILPPLTSQAVSLVKDSALVSTIAVYDLTMEGRTIIAETFLTFEVWFTIAAIYLLLTVSLSLVAQNMKRYLARSA